MKHAVELFGGLVMAAAILLSPILLLTGYVVAIVIGINLLGLVPGIAVGIVLGWIPAFLLHAAVLWTCRGIAIACGVDRDAFS